MAEGATVIAAGLLVVLCIMLSMFVLIELILKLDQILKDRAERAAASRALLSAEESREAEPEASSKRDAVAAVIGLALQQHLARRVAPRSPAAEAGAGPTPWAASGRLGIMSDRQRVTRRLG